MTKLLSDKSLWNYTLIVDVGSRTDLLHTVREAVRTHFEDPTIIMGTAGPDSCWNCFFFLFFFDE